MNHLPKWKQLIAWTIIYAALPFVGAWCAWRKLKRRLWAANFVKETYGRG